MLDQAFQLDPSVGGVSLHDILNWHEGRHAENLPPLLPEVGIGESAVLDALAGRVLGKAAQLGTEFAFAHMDPPTPWISWILTLWNARLNQNLLHPATAPVARGIEERVLQWMAPYFGMSGGHMVPGATVANITAIWAARERHRITEVVASSASHVSIEKTANLLGLKYRSIDVDEQGRLDSSELGDLSTSCLVLTAGTTSVGAIDPLDLSTGAAWVHVDAAWAGPLRLAPSHAHLLDGIDRADSVAVSAHKLLFQPKESALVLFRDANAAHAALTFGGAYLASPNVGLLGSHGASAAPLLATLWAWGHRGIAARLSQCMEKAAAFAYHIAQTEKLELWNQPASGVIVWRPRDMTAEQLHAKLPSGSASLTSLEGTRWLRNVAANPNANVEKLFGQILDALP